MHEDATRPRPQRFIYQLPVLGRLPGVLVQGQDYQAVGDFHRVRWLTSLTYDLEINRRVYISTLCPHPEDKTIKQREIATGYDS